MSGLVKSGIAAVIGSLGGPWGYVGVAVIAGGLAAYGTSLGYRVTIAEMERDRAVAVSTETTAALAQFSNDAGRIHAAAMAFGGKNAALETKLDTLARNFDDYAKARPLPRGCLPDSFRMQSLADSIDATNAALGFGPGPAVPAAP